MRSYLGNTYTVNGKPARLKRWEASDGTTVEVGEEYAFVPTADTTFTAQWNTNLVKITFKPGMKLVWEEDDGWHYIDSDGMYCTTYEEAHAKSYAASSWSIYVEKGVDIGHMIPTPEAVFNDKGIKKMLTAWKAADGTEISVRDPAYTPQKNTTLTAVWDTDLITVNFNYGSKVIWQTEDGYSYIGSDGYAHLALDLAEAQANAAESVSYLTSAKFPFNKEVPYPSAAVTVSGTEQMMTGWLSEDGKISLEPDSTTFQPTGSISLNAQWTSDLIKVTFDYGYNLYVPSGYGYWYMDSTGCRNYSDDEEFAREHAARTFTMTVIRGDTLGTEPVYTRRAITIGGKTRLMKNWTASDDASISVDLWGIYRYTPDRDITFNMNWADDLYEVTLDFGLLPVWKEGTTYNTVFDGEGEGIFPQTGFETYEEAASEAYENYSFYVEKGEYLDISVVLPEGNIYKDGKALALVNWVSEDSTVQLTTGEIETYKPARNIVLNAQFTADTYKINYDLGTDGIETLYYAKNSTVGGNHPSPRLSKDEKQRFVCWKDASGNKIDDIYSYVVASDQTFTAVWEKAVYYTVTVHPNNGEEDIEISDVLVGTVYNSFLSDFWGNHSPTPPFKGADGEFYVDAALTQSLRDYLNGQDGIRSNMELYIKWVASKQTYSISFNANGHGTAPAAMIMVEGATLTPPPEPTASGYTFVGWYEDAAASGDLYKFLTMPSKNITLYAKWEVTTNRRSMYRLYNANSGEHFYTASATERDNLVSVGWNYEGIAWTAPASAGTPVYRLFNPNARNTASVVVGDHHYTTSAEEKDNLVSIGWQYEGIGWFSDGPVALHRLYNPNADAGSHHYTPSVAEKSNLEAAGWKYEGVSWFGL